MYKLKFIDSYRFVAAKLEDLADNLSEINKQEYKKCKEKLKYIKRKNDVLICKCKTCNNKSYKSIDSLKESFPNT